MYICQICKQQQRAGTPCKSIVITEDYHHPFRSGKPPETPKGAPKKPSPVGEHWEWDHDKKKWKFTWYNDSGGIGRQIIKELKACPNCAK